MPAPEQIDEWSEVHTRHAVKRRLGAITEPHVERLLFFRHVKRPEYPVPDGQRESHVVAEMPRLNAVVDLVLGRTDENSAEHGPVRQPHMRMSQVADQVVGEDEDVQAVIGVVRGIPADDVGENSTRECQSGSQEPSPCRSNQQGARESW